MNINGDELKSLKFYQGSLKTEKDETYYSIKHAYVTLNALMFDGIENEKARVAEGKKLRPEIIRNVSETLNVYNNIFLLMKKSIRDTSYYTFRADREQAMSIINKEKRTISFLSTSKVPIPDDCFRNKCGLVLMEIDLPAGFPCIDFELIFKEGDLFYEQKEVLIPPFLNVEISEIELTKDEQLYKDINGNMPVGKYRLSVKGIYNQESEIDEKSLKSIVFDDDIIETAVEVIGQINEEIKIDKNKLKMYLVWKKAFRNSVYLTFKSMFHYIN